jgi:hypothetical protein
MVHVSDSSLKLVDDTIHSLTHDDGWMDGFDPVRLDIPLPLFRLVS